MRVPPALPHSSFPRYLLAGSTHTPPAFLDAEQVEAREVRASVRD